MPEHVSTKFVKDRVNTFLAAARLKSKLESADRSRVAEEVVQRASIFTSTYQTKCSNTPSEVPRFVRKIISYLVKEVKLIFVRSIISFLRVPAIL